MPTNDSFARTLDLFRAQEKKMLEDLKSIRFTIRNIEKVAGIESAEPDPMDLPAGASLVDGVPTAPVFAGGKPKLRADEFFGLTQAEAARRYLKRIGHAVSFDELADALQEGGCKLTGTNPQKVLYISLIRNTRDFVPPRPGFVGLREFYPARARGPADKAKDKVRKLDRSKKPRFLAKPEGHVKPKKAGEVANALLSVMSDKQARSLQELVDAVSESLERPVKDFAIRGVLSSSKNYEQADGRYRLID